LTGKELLRRKGGFPVGKKGKKTFKELLVNTEKKEICSRGTGSKRG